MVVVAKDSIPRKVIALGEPGNEIDLKNPPDFFAMNKVFPPLPPVCRSKRQARYNPDLTTSKRCRHKGEHSATPSLVDLEYNIWR